MSAVPVSLLVGLALAEAILLAASIILLLGHAAHARVRARRDDQRLAVLHAALPRQLADGPSRGSATALRALPFRLQVRLLDELAPNLTGAHRAHLVSLMTRVGMTRRAERLCASRRWWRRLHGLRLLTVLHAGSGLVPKPFS